MARSRPRRRSKAAHAELSPPQGDARRGRVSDSPRMKDTGRCSTRFRSRRLRAGRCRRCRSMSAIAATSPACIATSTPGPGRTEEMDGATVDVVLDFLERRRISTLDITGGAPELNPHFRRLVTRRARHGREGDGPLQPHDPGAAGPGRPRRIPRRQSGRDRRLDAVLPAGQCRQAARQGRVSTARSAACRSSTRSATAARARA